MLHNPRVFLERLNRCLDDMDAPLSLRDRAAILNKLIDIPRPSAFSMLQGQLFPDETVLKKIAEEFEVEITWLIGNH